MSDNKTERELLQILIRAVKHLATDASPLHDEVLCLQISDLHCAIADRLNAIDDRNQQAAPPTGTTAFDTIGKACSGKAAALNTRNRRELWLKS